jgi:hypothetical protein
LTCLARLHISRDQAQQRDDREMRDFAPPPASAMRRSTCDFSPFGRMPSCGRKFMTSRGLQFLADRLPSIRATEDSLCAPTPTIEQDFSVEDIFISACT